MPRVIHFEICADEPERTATFYQEVFGWEVRKWDGPSDTWLLLTGEDNQPGINGALVFRDDSATEESVNLIDVPSVDEAMLRVRQGGGHVMGSIRSIPGVGFVAYCRDTDGNPFGVIELDDTAV